jgi:hypothetical protein
MPEGFTAQRSNVLERRINGCAPIVPKTPVTPDAHSTYRVWCIIPVAVRFMIDAPFTSKDIFEYRDSI